MAVPRVLLFQYFRFFISFRPDFFRNLFFLGHFYILRNKMLCPEDRRPLPGGAVHFLSPPPGPPSPGGGGRTNFRDLNPVWERERGRVNRDALTRLKTPEGSADLRRPESSPGNSRRRKSSSGDANPVQDSSICILKII